MEMSVNRAIATSYPTASAKLFTTSMCFNSKEDAIQNLIIANVRYMSLPSLLPSGYGDSRVGGEAIAVIVREIPDSSDIP